MRWATRIRAALAVCLMGAACAPAAPLEVAHGPGRTETVLFGATDKGVVALDARTGTPLFDAAGGVLSAGSKGLFATSSRGPLTRVTRLDALLGRVRSRIDLKGNLAASVVSGSGRLLALTEPRSPGATPWLPDGRRRTKVVVAEPGGAPDPLAFTLRGNFEPEAFSTNDRRLFMIEYIPALSPDRYRVRILNLASGRVRPIGRLKDAGPRQMRGTGRMQVLHPSGEQLYTLYTQQGPNYAHGAPAEHRKGESRAFIHVLSLAEAWAHCIDLPAPFGTGVATASAVAISPDGERLYVSDWTNGALALVKPNRVRVARVERLELGSANDATFAQAGAEDLYVAGNSDVVAVDAQTLSVRDRWTMDAEVTGLALSADGARLYVSLHGGEILTLNAADGRILDSSEIRGLEGLLGLR